MAKSAETLQPLQGPGHRLFSAEARPSQPRFESAVSRVSDRRVRLSKPPSGSIFGGRACAGHACAKPQHPGSRSRTARGWNETGSGPAWPWEALELLTESLPQLTHLIIHFGLASKCQRLQHWEAATMFYRCDIKCFGPDPYAQPLLNRTSAVEMVGFLQRHKAGRPFETLTFIAGDWNASRHKPLVISRWLKGQRVWVACRLANTPLSAGPRENTSEMACDAETLTTDAHHEWDDVCSGMSQDEIK